MMFQTILAVDDSQVVLNLHELSFKKFPNVELIYATNGLQALDQLEARQDIEIVLLDLHMPHMNGIEFLRTLRKKDTPQAEIPVVMISTEGEENKLAEALRSGATAFLKKPFRQKELFELLSALEERMQRKKS